MVLPTIASWKEYHQMVSYDLEWDWNNNLLFLKLECNHYREEYEVVLPNDIVFKYNRAWPSGCGPHWTYMVVDILKIRNQTQVRLDMLLPNSSGDVENGIVDAYLVLTKSDIFPSFAKLGLSTNRFYNSKR